MSETVSTLEQAKARCEATPWPEQHRDDCAWCAHLSQPPTLGKIKRTNGVAGQVAYDVEVTYPGQQPSTATFVGSVYGGPVVMVLPSGVQTFVTEPSQYGKFSPTWVRRFFGTEER